MPIKKHLAYVSLIVGPCWSTAGAVGGAVAGPGVGGGDTCAAANIAARATNSATASVTNGCGVKYDREERIGSPPGECQNYRARPAELVVRQDCLPGESTTRETGAAAAGSPRRRRGLRAWLGRSAAP